MDKNRLNELMIKAENSLNNSQCPLFKKNKNEERSDTIFENYNGMISALGVSILMIGLKPTIAVYYQDQTSSNGKGCRCNLLKEVFKILNPEKEVKSEFEKWIKEILKDGIDSKKQDILDCSVALKYIIRTHKLG
jgi:hypothetical protein